MRGDIPQAAFRLMQSLPVRTHTRPEVQRTMFQRTHSGGKTGMRIEYAGVIYESKKHAQKALNVGYHTIEKWVAAGRARVL